MKQKLTLTLFTILFISTSLLAQEDFTIYEKQKASAKSGYIITKDNEYKGVLLLQGTDKDNSEFIIYMNHRKAPIQKYSKYEINEYGYDNVVYETIERNGDIVFMRRMNDSAAFLYYYKSNGVKEFYVKDNEQFELLPQKKNDLVNTLNNKYQECNLAPKITELAINNKRRLTNIINRLNNCDNHKIPYFKIGVMGGYNLHKLSLNTEKIFITKEIEKISMQVPYYGIFLDIPFLDKNLNFTFHPEIEFSKVDQYTIEHNNIEYSFDIKYITTNLFFRYNTLKPGSSFICDFGLIISNLNIIDPTNNNTNQEFETYMNDNMFGAGVGIGVEIPISKRGTINLGIRTSYLISQNKMPNVWNTGLQVGLSF